MSYLRVSNLLLLAVAVSATNAAAGPKNPEIAFAMGVLWRVQDRVCPGVSFNPAVLAAIATPPNMSPDMLKARFREDFDKGFALAGESIAGGDAREYCQAWVVDFAGGRKSIFGQDLPKPYKPMAGLTFR